MKGILITILFLFFFIGDIAFIFSEKRLSDESKFESFPEPISYKISNEFSSNDYFHKADSVFSKFLIKHQIKGASLAIAKDGKLMMAKGYGYANIENSEVVEPKHLFRIASVSKLLTAVSILKLYEDGKLDIDTNVFGENGILNDSVFLNFDDKRISNITVRHLLNHSGGWSKKRPDPMFSYYTVAKELKKKLPVSIDDIIVYALTKKLDYTPGTRSSYSNLGYAILGKVIEKISGMEYEKYVKKEILFPLGIYDMHIARNYYHQRFTNEVTYYDRDNSRKIYPFDGSRELVTRPYGGNDMKTIAATGGWLASPSELIKLILAIDGFDSQPDILLPETIEMMVSADKLGPYGWKGTSYGFWWRTGTLSGTSALVARQNNDICWVALFNTSTSRPTKFHRYIHHVMNNIIASVTSWPDHDLFKYDIKQKNSLFAVN